MGKYNNKCRIAYVFLLVILESHNFRGLRVCVMDKKNNIHRIAYVKKANCQRIGYTITNARPEN